MEGFLYNTNRFNDLSIMQEPKLMLGNSLIKNHFKSDSSRLGDSLINQIAQGDGSVLSKSSRLVTLRYEGNKGSIEGSYDPTL